MATTRTMMDSQPSNMRSSLTAGRLLRRLYHGLRAKRIDDSTSTRAIFPRSVWRLNDAGQELFVGRRDLRACQAKVVLLIEAAILCTATKNSVDSLDKQWRPVVKYEVPVVGSPAAVSLASG